MTQLVAIPPFAPITRSLPHEGNARVQMAMFGKEVGDMRYLSMQSVSPGDRSPAKIYHGTFSSNHVSPPAVLSHDETPSKRGAAFNAALAQAAKGAGTLGQDVPQAVFDTAEGVSRFIASMEANQKLVQITIDGALTSRLITSSRDGFALLAHVATMLETK